MADRFTDEDEVIEDMEEDRPYRGSRAATTTASTKKQKGRGFQERSTTDDRYTDRHFEALEPTAKGSAPAKSVEGWVIFITGVHEEAQEEDINEAFAEFGDVKNVYLNLDRQTGFVKGYALVEYSNKKEAEDAIRNMHDKDMLGQRIDVGWAFSTGPISKLGGGRRVQAGGERWSGMRR